MLCKNYERDGEPPGSWPGRGGAAATAAPATIGMDAAAKSAAALFGGGADALVSHGPIKEWGLFRWKDRGECAQNRVRLLDFACRLCRLVLDANDTPVEVADCSLVSQSTPSMGRPCECPAAVISSLPIGAFLLARFTRRPFSRPQVPVQVRRGRGLRQQEPVHRRQGRDHRG